MEAPVATVTWTNGRISATGEGIDFTMTPKRGKPVHQLIPWATVRNICMDGTTMELGLTDAPDRQWPGCTDAAEVEAFVAVVRSHDVAERSRSTRCLKVYASNDELLKDSAAMQVQGWRMVHQESDKRRVAKGRTFTKAIIFLPWALLSPARHRASTTTVTWVRD